MPQTLSPAFQQLLREPSYCQIATIMPDGSPHLAEVWVDTDGEHILINTPAKTQKMRNIRRDPRVAVNVFDAQNQWRLATVRGKVVEITTEGADASIDRLAKRYRDLDEYPWKDPDNPRTLLKIQADKVREMGLD